MSFGNALMALGAAAFAVPLVIHLLFRSRYRSLDWGAMFLLRNVVQVNRRRMRWHQWILLLLRCAIPILLALAMARPLISSVQSIAGKQPVSLILMIDDSRSMSAGSRSGRAIAAVNELLDSMSGRDEVIVIPASRLSAPVATGSLQDARQALRRIRFDGGIVNFASLLRSATAACREASHPYKRVVVVSDFQQNGFRGSAETGSHASSFLGSIDSISERLAQLDPRPQLDFLDVGEPEADDESLANVVVESIQTDAPAVLVDRTVPLTATVRNDSDLPVPGVRASWIVDGQVAETQTLSIEARGTARLNWKTTFDRPGGASVGLSIEHTDAIASDNRRALAINVLRPIRVWLVDGQPSIEPLQSETDFLQVALSPFAFRATDRQNRLSARNRKSRPVMDADTTLSEGGPSEARGGRALDSAPAPPRTEAGRPSRTVNEDRGAEPTIPRTSATQRDANSSLRHRDLVSTQVISPRKLTQELADLDFATPGASPQSKTTKSKLKSKKTFRETPDLIVLANVSRPPDASRRDRSSGEVDPLTAYLGAGGHVLFFDGELVDAETWQSCEWLPAGLGEIVSAEETPFRIDPPGARLAAWRTLGNSEDSLFDSVEVTRRRTLQVHDSASVLLLTDSGAPLAVASAPHHSRIGADAGENANEDASDSEHGTSGMQIPSGRVVQFAFPCDTAWSNLPLRPVFLPMIQQLVLDMVGSDQPSSDPPGTPLLVRADPIRLASETGDGVWQVTTPDGKSHPLSTPITQPLLYTHTSRVGAYQFSDRIDSSEDQSSLRVVRVIEVPAAESVLRRVAPELLAECAKRLHATNYQDAGVLVAATQRERFGTEIWRPLLWMLLLIMIAEVLWQQIGVTRNANRLPQSLSGAVP